MIKKLKKGFTIVELVIVIAIVAILAAVLVPTFANIIDKANVSADTMLVRNLNTALKADNQEHKTMTSALQAAKDAGYDISRINAQATNSEILWDSLNDSFCYEKDGEIVYLPETTDKKEVGANKYYYWQITNKGETLSRDYSNYLAADYVVSDTLEIFTGLDVGEVTGIASISYKNPGSEKDVVICTNSSATTLTITAPLDTVTHYGEAGNVEVVSVAGQSYHERGKVVGTISVESGHIKVESGAEVASVVAAVKPDENTAIAPPTVTAANGAKVGTVVVNNVEAEIKVESGATVAEVAPGKDVTLDGLKVSGITPSETPIDTTQASKFAGGLGTEASPYLIANETQFYNINIIYAQKTDEGVVYDGSVYFFKQISDIEIQNWNCINAFTGEYDGNNKTISYADTVGYTNAYLFKIVFKDTTIKNVNYCLKKNQAISLICTSDWETDKLNLTLENITIDSKGQTVVANGTNFGLFGQFITYNYSSIRFVNCTNKAHLNNSGTSTGVFVGSGFWIYEGDDSKVEFINCVNEGDITGTCNTGVMYGNPSYVGTYVYDSESQKDKKTKTEYQAENFVVKNFINNGKIVSNLNTGIAAIAPNSEYCSSLVVNNGTCLVGGCFEGSTVYVDLSDGFKFSSTKNLDGVTYKVAFNISVIYNTAHNTVSNTTKYFYDIQQNQTVASNNLTQQYIAYSEAKAAEKLSVNTSELTFQSGIAFYIKDNVTYLIFKNDKLDGNQTLGKGENVGTSAVSVLLYAYDSQGLCIGTLSLK